MSRNTMADKLGKNFKEIVEKQRSKSVEHIKEMILAGKGIDTIEAELTEEFERLEAIIMRHILMGTMMMGCLGDNDEEV